MIGLEVTVGFSGSSPTRSWHECINDRFIFDKLLTYFPNLWKGKGGGINVDVEPHAFVNFESRENVSHAFEDNVDISESLSAGEWWRNQFEFITIWLCGGTDDGTIGYHFPIGGCMT